MALENLKVAMVPALTWDNTWYIFRNTKEQVEITRGKENNIITSTHVLSVMELQFIKENYPLLFGNVLNYKVIKKVYR